MKKIKGIMAVLLCTMLISGCTQSSSESIVSEAETIDVVDLVVWGSPNERALLEEMVAEFQNEYADQAQFNITLEAVSEGDCKVKILEDINSAPDVFSFADDQLIELAAAGVVEPVEGAEQLKAEHSESAIEAAAIDEKVYAYPMTADNGYFMYYNKKYLSEEDVKTLDKMLDVAEALNKKVTMDMTSGWYFYSFFGNTGLKLGLNADSITNYCDWNSTTGAIKGVDIGNAISSIVKRTGFLNIDDDSFIAGAKDGSVIAGISGVWNADVLMQIWGDDFAAAKLPTYTCADQQVQMASYAGYKMIGVNSYSKEKEWAEKMAEWLTNEKNQTLRFNKRGLGPSNINAANAEEVKQSPAIGALMAQAQYSSLQRVGANYWEPAQAFAKEIAEGSITSAGMQDAMDAMVKEITMKITDY